MGKEMCGRSPAVMVSCGGRHTLVLTAVGVWSCGWGYYCQLGHGDTADKLVLMLVGAEGIRVAQIVMVAAGGLHRVALRTEWRVLTWGFSSYLQLDHNNKENSVGIGRWKLWPAGPG